MLKVVKTSLSAAVVIGLTAIASQASGQGAPNKAAFAPCSVCHAVTPKTNKIGPSLHQIVGRKVGTYPGYTYSPAMKAKGGVWTEAALDTYLTKPPAYVKGTKMAYPGQPDPAKRKAIIAYLKTRK